MHQVFLSLSHTGFQRTRREDKTLRCVIRAALYSEDAMLNHEEIPAGEDPRWPRDVDARLKRLGDATLEVKYVLGRTRLTLEQLADVKKDSLIETSTLSGMRVKMLVNGVLFGEGEIVVVRDQMAFRIAKFEKTSIA